MLSLSLRRCVIVSSCYSACDATDCNQISTPDFFARRIPLPPPKDQKSDAVSSIAAQSNALLALWFAGCSDFVSSCFRGGNRQGGKAGSLMAAAQNYKP